MGVVHSIISVKSKIEYQGITCMFLGYVKNHMDSTYQMLNLQKKYEVLRLGFIRIKREYGDYAPRHQNRKTDDYVIQDKNDNKKAYLNY